MKNNEKWQWNLGGDWGDVPVAAYTLFTDYAHFASWYDCDLIKTRKITSGDFSFDEDPPVDNYPKY